MLGTALALAVGGATLSTAAADARPREPRTERVSTAGDGSQIEEYSRAASISADGRYVAFFTKAAQLPGCEITAYVCLTVKDRVTGALTEIPHGGGSGWQPPVVSGGGRYIGYTEGTKSPTPWLYDRETGTSLKVLPPPEFAGELLAVTPDGGHVAFTTGDRFHPDTSLYVRNMATGAVELIAGDDADRLGTASLSADGTFLAYGTSREPEGRDVLVRNRATGETVQADTGLGDSDATFVQMSENGRRVLFVAEGRTYLYDVRKQTTRQIADTPAKSASGDARYAVLADGTALTLLDVHTHRRTPIGPGSVAPAAVSAKGRTIAFTSDATDLVPNDTNGASDVFVRHTR
ncbi:hypothetical protein GCM10010252_57310 [Streptomyces aureoverticillatus]|nr:hypothetical protein GCM10010252_57310 [Streptomyces aureoverticillatus]